jgi:hypothetical protein
VEGTETFKVPPCRFQVNIPGNKLYKIYPAFDFLKVLFADEQRATPTI